MSSYATLADLVTFGIPAAALVGVSDPIKTAHLGAASGKVDSYLNSKFDLPLVTWGSEITLIVVQLAQYTLLTSRGFDPENSPDREIKGAYDEAVKWLEGITLGEINPIVKDSNPTQHQYGGPNILQMNTEPSNQARPDGLISSVDTGGPGIITVGPPRQRGWR